jgi:hypothetical protein
MPQRSITERIKDSDNKRGEGQPMGESKIEWPEDLRIRELAW